MIEFQKIVEMNKGFKPPSKFQNQDDSNITLKMFSMLENIIIEQQKTIISLLNQIAISKTENQDLDIQSILTAANQILGK